MARKSTKVYSSRVAWKVCKITPRTLDYWVTTGVIAPSKAMTTNRRGRKYFLFTFEDLVRLKIVKSLRDEGVSLGAIRTAIAKLKSRHGPGWQKAWLRTDGKGVFTATDEPEIVESLRKGETGQLVMSVVAVGRVEEWVSGKLKKFNPVDPDRYDATVVPWNRIADS